MPGMAGRDAEVTIPADGNGVRAAAAFAADFAARHQLAAALGARLRLLAEELISNLAKYGYAEGAPRGTATVALSLTENHVRIVIVDDGAPFDPTTTPAPDLEIPADQRTVGGLGLNLVRTLTESAQYARVGGRNRTRLMVRLDVGHDPQEQESP
jgi:serine/threonine-protein kinase RsbW